MPFDAVRFCKDHNVPYALEGKNVGNGYVGINDPFALHDSTFHGAFNPIKGTFTSWKTGSHTLVDVICALIGVNRKKAYEIIKQYDSVTLYEEKLNKKPFKISESRPSQTHKDFIESRGFNPNILIQKYDIRADNFNLVFPVYYYHKIVSYQERDIRYKFYKSCPTETAIINYKDILYNLDNCKKNYVVVVEGLFDVFRMGDNCCGTFGISYTKKQVALLANLFTHVIIMFDPEPEAQKKAQTMGSLLEMMGVEVGIEQNYCTYMEAKDPGELTDRQAESYMSKLQRLYSAV